MVFELSRHLVLENQKQFELKPEVINDNGSLFIEFIGQPPIREYINENTKQSKFEKRSISN